MFAKINNLKENVYIAIGSAPHTNLDKYTDDKNQLYPPFVRDGEWTLIHIDPEFEKSEKQEFVSTYFKRQGFISDGNIFTSPTMDALFISKYMEIEERNVFLINMMKKIIGKGKLIVQEFTGRELFSDFQKIAKTFPPNQFSSIKKNVLWDITYGRDCSCMTNMSIWKPLFTNDGFFNLACMTDDEIIAEIGKDTKIDEMIAYRFKTEYKRLIDIHHVNYRRRIKGMENYMNMPEYDNNVTPAEIMVIFSSYLYPIIKVLKQVTGISDEKYAKQVDMLNNYHEYDVYKWYSFMCGIYN